jgi:hypothetical protein
MQWRANKITRFIPKKLWKDVAALVPGTTINRISKMLRLNHSDIKRHLHLYDNLLKKKLA